MLQQAFLRSYFVPCKWHCAWHIERHGTVPARSPSRLLPCISEHCRLTPNCSPMVEKNKMSGDRNLLLKCIMHLLKSDTRASRFDWRCYLYPLLVLFNYNMALLDVIFPHLFLACISISNIFIQWKIIEMVGLLLPNYIYYIYKYIFFLLNI